MIARDDLGEWPTSNEDRQITNIVFMGMGEPLYNLDHVSDAIDVISDGMTASPSAAAASRCPPPAWCRKSRNSASAPASMLAISLHATNDDLRNELVPLNKKYPIAELMDAIRAYPDLSNAKRVTFEYVMLKGVNDSLAEARERWSGCCKGIPVQDQSDPVQSLAGQPV
jgi:23S rRNA (adenine2503-C2)-methyltransferase